MIKIGAVDPDTSHPQAWIDILNEEERARYVAVYNHGDVHDDEYVKKFAEKNGLDVCASVEDMIPKVDIAFFHGCDWDARLARAMPFIDAGKPVFLDKPTVGSMRDVLKMKELAEKGAVIVGGSSLRYAKEVREWLAQPPEERGEILTAMATTGTVDDPFNYGIHGIELLQGLLGPGVESVRFIGKSGPAELFEVSYASGVLGILQIQAPFHTFALTVSTTKGLHHIQIGKAAYKALLDRVLDFMDGKTEALVGVDAMAESIVMSIAMKRSRELNRRVFLNDVSVDDEGYHGRTFAENYRIAREARGR